MNNTPNFRANIITKEIVEQHKRINAYEHNVWRTYTSLKKYLSAYCTTKEEYDYGIKRIVSLLEI